MFNPIIVRSGIYAGLISNVLAIVVCFICGENQYIARKAGDLTMWLLTYMFHKKWGAW